LKFTRGFSNTTYLFFFKKKQRKGRRRRGRRGRGRRERLGEERK
jgi:hypothetical protein